MDRYTNGSSSQINHSKKVAQAAIKLAISESREEEAELKEIYLQRGVKMAAMDFGGEAVSSIAKIIERAVVGAKREHVIQSSHAEEGAVAGATHEVLTQVLTRTIGLNFGGKIAVARMGGHLCVAVFFAIGMIHLDDVALAIAHRAVEDI